MKTRIHPTTSEPGALKAMLGLEQYLSGTAINPHHKELIKIRASQINGCSYCINKHSKDARKLGEREQRLYLLSAWRETELFSEEERVILAMTEEITLISQRGLTEETYHRALELFGETLSAQLIMAIITINAWNRIGVSAHMKPEADNA